MNLQEQIYSVLIVSAKDTFNASLQALLPNSKFSPVRFENSISAAKRLLLERSYDFVIVNSPLPDDAGTRFSVDLCSTNTTVALLMVPSELYTSVYSKVTEHGVYVLSKPTAKLLVTQAIDWMIASRERLRRLEKKSVSIEEKMQEIRTVNRAKWLLIEHLKMTEAEAHHSIEKQAMDCCTTKKEIAENIIKTYT